MKSYCNSKFEFKNKPVFSTLRKLSTNRKLEIFHSGSYLTVRMTNMIAIVAQTGVNYDLTTTSKIYNGFWSIGTEDNKSMTDIVESKHWHIVGMISKSRFNERLLNIPNSSKAWTKFLTSKMLPSLMHASNTFQNKFLLNKINCCHSNSNKNESKWLSRNKTFTLLTRIVCFSFKLILASIDLRFSHGLNNFLNMFDQT